MLCLALLLKLSLIITRLANWYQRLDFLIFPFDAWRLGLQALDNHWPSVARRTWSYLWLQSSRECFPRTRCSVTIHLNRFSGFTGNSHHCQACMCFLQPGVNRPLSFFPLEVKFCVMCSGSGSLLLDEKPGGHSFLWLCLFLRTDCCFIGCFTWSKIYDFQNVRDGNRFHFHLVIRAISLFVWQPSWVIWHYVIGCSGFCRLI